MPRTSTAAVLFLAASGFCAQAQTAPANQGSTAEMTRQTADQFLSANLKDQPVYSPDGAGLGEIDDVLIERNGQVKAVIVDLGRGAAKKLVALPFGALDIQKPPTVGSEPRSVKIFIKMGRTELERAPAFHVYDGK
jgi:sporulation protein YlmC with PRC-barrel domain